jgi:hypothetical protein
MRSASLGILLFFRVKKDVGDRQENGIEDHSSTCFELHTSVMFVMLHAIELDLLFYWPNDGFE